MPTICVKSGFAPDNLSHVHEDAKDRDARQYENAQARGQSAFPHADSSRSVLKFSSAQRDQKTHAVFLLDRRVGLDLFLFFPKFGAWTSRSHSVASHDNFPPIFHICCTKIFFLSIFITVKVPYPTLFSSLSNNTLHGIWCSTHKHHHGGPAARSAGSRVR